MGSAGRYFAKEALQGCLRSHLLVYIVLHCQKYDADISTTCHGLLVPGPVSLFIIH
jgi:hypothetical protein